MCVCGSFRNLSVPLPPLLMATPSSMAMYKFVLLSAYHKGSGVGSVDIGGDRRINTEVMQ